MIEVEIKAWVHRAMNARIKAGHVYKDFEKTLNETTEAVFLACVDEMEVRLGIEEQTQ